MKFILHSLNPDNLSLMARAAATCAKKDMKDGDFGTLSYRFDIDGREVANIPYIKRKSCITLYEQEVPHDPS